MTANEFVLRHVVQKVLADTNEADPGKLAGLVMARIPKAQIRVALSQALRLYVRQVISEARNGGSATVTPIRPNASAKVAAIRDGWQRRLRDRVHVADSWKLLADCTYDDLLAAAAERRTLADQNNARARQFDGWARLVNEYDAATFADLPAEVQMQALGRAA